MCRRCRRTAISSQWLQRRVAAATRDPPTPHALWVFWGWLAGLVFFWRGGGKKRGGAKPTRPLTSLPLPPAAAIAAQQQRGEPAAAAAAPAPGPWRRGGAGAAAATPSRRPSPRSRPGTYGPRRLPRRRRRGGRKRRMHSAGRAGPGGGGLGGPGLAAGPRLLPPAAAPGIGCRLLPSSGEMQMASDPGGGAAPRPAPARKRAAPRRARPPAAAAAGRRGEGRFPVGRGPPALCPGEGRGDGTGRDDTPSAAGPRRPPPAAAPGHRRLPAGRALRTAPPPLRRSPAPRRRPPSAGLRALPAPAPGRHRGRAPSGGNRGGGWSELLRLALPRAGKPGSPPLAERHPLPASAPALPTGMRAHGNNEKRINVLVVPCLTTAGFNRAPLPSVSRRALSRT